MNTRHLYFAAGKWSGAVRSQNLPWWWAAVKPPVLGFWPCTLLAGSSPHLVWMQARESPGAEAGHLCPIFVYQRGEQQPGLTPAHMEKEGLKSVPCWRTTGHHGVSCQHLKIQQSLVWYLGICTARKVCPECAWKQCCESCTSQKWGAVRIKCMSLQNQQSLLQGTNGLGFDADHGVLGQKISK